MPLASLTSGLSAALVGVMVAAGVYLMLRRNLVRLVIGFIIVSNAVNLLIFGMGRLTRAEAPFIPDGSKYPPEGIANPLSQALILTAIVIGFGMLSFALVLLYRNGFGLFCCLRRRLGKLLGFLEQLLLRTILFTGASEPLEQ